MEFNIVKAIFFKEVKDTIRDSKTLFIMILLPLILYPLLSIGAGQILIQQGKKIESRKAIVYINNQDNSLSDFLSEKEKIILVQSKKPLKDLTNGRINAYINIPDDFENLVKNTKTAPIKIYFDQANINSLNARSKIYSALEDYKQSLIEKRIIEKGFKKEILFPFEDEAINIAPKEKIGGFYLGNILPFLIIFMIILGAFYPAIDQMAGEKERGTLETLLTTPVKKYEIITGKFLTISLFAFITGLLNLISMTLSMTLLLSSDKINFQVPWNSMWLIFVILIPTTMFFVAIMMLVASLANSFKDAQNYLTPVYLICGFPAMVTVFPGFELNFNSALIPVANVSLLIKELLLGHYEFDLIIVVMISMTIYSVLAITAATSLFSREDVLLSEESNLKLLFSNKSKLKKVPSFMESIFLYIVTFALLFYVGSILQSNYKLNGLLFTEILLVLLPAYLFTKLLKFDMKETFSLKKVSIQSMFGSLLLALSGSFFVLKLVTKVQEYFLPMPKELKEAFFYFLQENGVQASMLKVLLIISVSAAVCEEFLFRGPLLAGIRTKFNKPLTIIIVGFLFGIFHMNIYRLLPTTILGMLITYIVMSTGSIFNGIFFHLINNGSAVLLSSEDDGLLWMSSNAEWYYYPIFALVFALGIYLISSENKLNKDNKT